MSFASGDSAMTIAIDKIKALLGSDFSVHPERPAKMSTVLETTPVVVVKRLGGDLMESFQDVLMDAPVLDIDIYSSKGIEDAYAKGSDVRLRLKRELGCSGGTGVVPIPVSNEASLTRAVNFTTTMYVD